VKVLVDENLTRQLHDLLRAYSHEAEHVADAELESASDHEILDRARHDKSDLIFADTDFGIAGESKARLPSIILIRRTSNRRTLNLASMIEANLPDLADDSKQAPWSSSMRNVSG
jgi:predicted nuclease of predicted toxin-antitoxin system